MNSTSQHFPQRQERLFLLILAGIQFTHILDFMIMMPLGPQLLRELGMDTQQFGLLLSSYTFTAAASGLVAAAYIDRFDRRRLLLVLYGLFTLATVCCTLAPNFIALLAARALAGAFGGILGALVQTMVADVIPFERRGQAMGTVMASFSLSTVAGVPLGLLLANQLPQLGWRAPFAFIVALCLLLLALALRQIPSLTTHLDGSPRNALRQIWSVATDPAHLRGFLFMALLVLGGFTVIPYIALYSIANVGMTEQFITLAYLCGGAATLFTSRLIGRLADRYGKLRMFRWVALGSLVLLLTTTHMPPLPWWIVLANAVAFFIFVPGRFVPGMAMVTAVAAPQVRGTFMSLASSVQMMFSGLASLAAGMIITRTAGGQLEHYNLVGYLAVACGLASLWAAQRLRVAPAQASAAPGEKRA